MTQSIGRMDHQAVAGTLRMNSTENPAVDFAAVSRIISDLEARFVSHDRFHDLRMQFDRLLYRRRADIEAGYQSDSYGIVVTGNAGSGKSTAFLRLFGHHPDLMQLQERVVEAHVVSLQVPSPATLKSVGMSCLHALGYPLSRDRTAMIVWQLVQHHLQARRVLFIHLDEAQDLFVRRGGNEMQAVINTLKSVMQNSSWPVGVILSGTEELKELVNVDKQLSRRLYPIEFQQISWTSHGRDVRDILKGYSAAAGLQPAGQICEPTFVRRLIHSASHELGLVIKLIIGAIEEALFRGGKDLDWLDFRLAFQRKSGCVDGLNPFVTDNWKAIDPLVLLPTEKLAGPA